MNAHAPPSGPTRVLTLAEFEAETLPMLRPPRETRFRRISLGEFRHRKPTSPDYIVDGWMVAREQSFLAGEPNSGKSFLAMHIALCIATGRDVLGRSVKPGLVIYQAGESGEGVLNQRIPAWMKHYGRDEDYSAPFEILPSRVDLFRPDADIKAFLETIKAIAAEHPDVPLCAVFIDTLSKAMPGANENDGRDISRVLSHVEMISRETGAHVCILHHVPKNGTGMRGHGSMKGDVDSVAMLSEDPETKIKTIRFDKMKDGPNGGTLKFELLQVKTGALKPDGTDVTSCVVLPLGEKEVLKTVASKGAWSPNPTETRVLTTLFQALKFAGRSPTIEEKREHGIPDGREIIHWNDYREKAKRLSVGGDDSRTEDGERKADAIRKEFERASAKLVQANVLGLSKPFMWWAGRAVKGFVNTYKQADGQPLSANMARTTGGQPADTDDVGLQDVGF